eukprot:scaffold51873_cov69-Phaeocystis_antarctica.AAC.6
MTHSRSSLQAEATRASDCAVMTPVTPSLAPRRLELRGQPSARRALQCEVRALPIHVRLCMLQGVPQRHNDHGFASEASLFLAAELSLHVLLGLLPNKSDSALLHGAVRRAHVCNGLGLALRAHLFALLHQVVGGLQARLLDYLLAQSLHALVSLGSLLRAQAVHAFVSLSEFRQERLADGLRLRGRLGACRLHGCRQRRGRAVRHGAFRLSHCDLHRALHLLRKLAAGQPPGLG